MYSMDSLKYAVKRLFLDGIGEHGYTDTEVQALLADLDYEKLLQAVRHRAETVYAYKAQGRAPKAFQYRGADLFGQRATLLYESCGQTASETVPAVRTYELWLLEDMSMAAAACVSLDYACGAYTTEYREIKEGDPWDSGMCLDLEELTARLLNLYGPESDFPLYEL